MYAASGLIIKIEKGVKKLLMIRRSPDKRLYPDKWAFPGGKSEEGETPEETVVREVKEEVGLDFVPERIFETNTNRKRKVFRFLGEVSGEIILQEEEVTDSGYFSFEEALDLDLGFNCDKVIGMLRDEGLI